MRIPEWFRLRWDMSVEDRSIFPSDYLDDLTTEQLSQIEQIRSEHDIDLAIMSGCKGQAADLIGLFELPDADDLQVLTFFNVEVAGYSRTQAKHEAAILLAKPKYQAAWQSRHANFLQKEFFLLFGIRMPMGASFLRAQKIIEGVLKRWSDLSDRREAEWAIYQALITEFSDSDVLSTYGISKPSALLLRMAVTELRSEGVSFQEPDLSDKVLTRLIELKPEYRLDRQPA